MKRKRDPSTSLPFKKKNENVLFMFEIVDGVENIY